MRRRVACWQSRVVERLRRDSYIKKVSWVEVWGELTAQGTTRGYARDDSWLRTRQSTKHGVIAGCRAGVGNSLISEGAGLPRGDM